MSRRRESPRACPKCGSCAVTSQKVHRTKINKRGVEHSCNRCGHSQPTAFPKVGSSTFTGKHVSAVHGSKRGMPTGCTQVRPAGNKYS